MTNQTNKPTEPGLWTREGKFYRVWIAGSEDSELVAMELGDDGREVQFYRVIHLPPGDWHNITAPATNAEAREAKIVSRDERTGVWMDKASGNSASRIIATIAMDAMGMDSWNDFRVRDKIIMAISKRVDAMLSDASGIFAGVEREADEPPEGFTECDTCRAKP